MKPRTMKTPKMAQAGHYRKPQLKVPGRMNAPTRGRVGKMTPSMKRLTPRPRRGR